MGFFDAGFFDAAFARELRRAGLRADSYASGALNASGSSSLQTDSTWR